MKSIGLLKNTIQEYDWGSHTAIAELLGNATPSSKPQAELWMGAHPKAPSNVLIDGRWVSLAEVIVRFPEEILGKTVAEKFSGRLPYLFKVLGKNPADLLIQLVFSLEFFSDEIDKNFNLFVLIVDDNFFLLEQISEDDKTQVLDLILVQSHVSIKIHHLCANFKELDRHDSNKWIFLIR